MATQETETLSAEGQQVKPGQQADIKNQEWFKKLDAESQSKVQDIFSKIEGLKAKLDGLNAEGAYKGTAAQSLFARINNNPKMKGDPEAKPTLDLYEFYRKGAETALSSKANTQAEIKKLETILQAMNEGLGDMQSTSREMRPEAGQKKYEGLETPQKDISKMSNADILKLAPTERLPYITEDTIKSSEIKSEMTIKFTFSSGGKLNRDLYMYTTAGQVLPNEVREASSNGVSYTRQGLSGEFYNPDNNKRLIIGEGTPVKIGKTEDISKISEENSKKYSNFIEKNKEYEGDKYKNIIETAIEKGIEPKMFAVVVERRSEEFESQNRIEQHELDIIAADVGRGLSGMLRGGDRYPIETASKVAQRTTPTTWQETLEKYGYKKDEVTAYRERNPEKIQQYNLAGLNDFTPAEYSYPAEKSESGTTLCSRTARRNLERMGVTDPHQGSSAKKSFEMYAPSEISPVTLQGNSNAKVADIYLDASKENESLGHRVAAFQKDGQWYVLDPYYAMPGMGKTQQPIPLELYKSTMEGKGRKFWGANYFA